MKLLYSLLVILSIISLSSAQNCAAFLNAFRDSSKCIQISIAGVHTQSLAQEGYKGNLVFSNNALIPKEPLINLQTYETSCNQGLVQPFNAPDSFKISDFRINFDGTLRINTNTVQLTCNGDVASYRLSNFNYFVAIRSYDSCPKLYYGEPCNTPTVAPTVAPTSTPSKAPFAISYAVSIDNQWITNGVTFYQYKVVLTNNESSAIKNIQVRSSNWNPTEFWNMVQLSNGLLDFPSFVNSIPIGGTHTFGFVSSTVNPTFSTVSISRV